jgi:hypothetical protein
VTVSSKKESHSTCTDSTFSEVEYGGEAIKSVDKIKSSAARLKLLKDTGIYFHQKKNKKRKVVCPLNHFSQKIKQKFMFLC